MRAKILILTNAKQTDGPTDRRTLLWRCEDASKNARGKHTREAEAAQDQDGEEQTHSQYGRVSLAGNLWPACCKMYNGLETAGSGTPRLGVH